MTEIINIEEQKTRSPQVYLGGKGEQTMKRWTIIIIVLIAAIASGITIETMLDWASYRGILINYGQNAVVDANYPLDVNGPARVTEVNVPASDDYRVNGQRLVDPNAFGTDWNGSGVAASRDALFDYLYKQEQLLSSTTVSLAADANTVIFTVPTGTRATLTKAILMAGADAGTSDISIGQDGAETDFAGVINLDNLDAQYDAVLLMPVPSATPTTQKSYAASTIIHALVANHAGGATNTLYLFGFLY